MPANVLSNPDEFAAALAEAAKGVVPANLPVETVATKLMAHRKALLGLKSEGFSPAQIVTFLQHPKINLNVSVVTLRKVLRTPRRKKQANTPSAPTKYTAAKPATPPAAPTK